MLMAAATRWANDERVVLLYWTEKSADHEMTAPHQDRAAVSDGRQRSE